MSHKYHYLVNLLNPCYCSAIDESNDKQFFDIDTFTFQELTYILNLGHETSEQKDENLKLHYHCRVDRGAEGPDGSCG